MAHDRSAGDEFPMTREFLAMMLGVRRAGVSVAAGQLQKAGLIRYERGCIEVTERPGLESASCECYGVVRRAQDSLLGPPAASKGVYRHGRRQPPPEVRCPPERAIAPARAHPCGTGQTRMPRRA
jgi:hypothetical protein